MEQFWVTSFQADIKIARYFKQNIAVAKPKLTRQGCQCRCYGRYLHIKNTVIKKRLTRPPHVDTIFYLNKRNTMEHIFVMVSIRCGFCEIYQNFVLLISKINYGSREGTSDFRLRTSDFRLQTSDFRIQNSDFRLQTSDFRLQTSDFRHWFRASLIANIAFEKLANI
jgi:hypothetical protein